MIAGIVFVCLFGGMVIWMMFLTKHKKDPAQEENLSDELLFDPLTGKKITLEEAERGMVVENYTGPRIKPDQEIEDNYSGERKEIEYILRDFIKSGIEETYHDDDEDSVFDDILAQSEYDKGPQKKGIHHLWELRPGLFFGLVYVACSYSEHGPSHECQPMAIIEDQPDITAFATIPDAYVELIEDMVLIRLPKRISHAGFKEFVEDVDNRLRGGR
ncbi:hypothetical protein SAMN04488109_3202 [Chryseolinea serpens]|uniref:Uncharacterized protein n=1 Tax=Chryseolinea serpens TaxID=947013 RepID=A0A1M5R586_9BACT|nr:hypothetical protein [Chryseolinea serpens]SHH21535.1 hypothetical protein SAMN04488109_3202 [Chryseolinea serpens]